MKKLALLSFAVISSLSVISCSDDDNNVLDTEKPTVIINTPTNDQVLHAGEEIHIDASFTDNVALAEYKVDIHFGGDGHHHKPLHDDDHDHEEWKFERTGTLSGTSDKIHFHTRVPHNAEEGPYHLGVFVIDAAGNENVAWITVDVHNHDHDH